jgi:hypothetical protein
MEINLQELVGRTILDITENGEVVILHLSNGLNVSIDAGWSAKPVFKLL